MQMQETEIFEHIRMWLFICTLEHHVLRRSTPSKTIEAWVSLKRQEEIRFMKMDESCNFIYIDVLKG